MVTPHFALNFAEKQTHLLAQICVQRRQRFVHQQNFGFDHQSAGQRDPLALPPAECVGRALCKCAQAHALQIGIHLGLDLGLALFACAETISDVVKNALVREQRIVLKHQTGVALVRHDMGHVPFAEKDLALLRKDETGNGPQHGGLAASAWPEQGEELPGRNRKRKPLQNGDRPERHRDIVESDLCHGAPRVVAREARTDLSAVPRCSL